MADNETGLRDDFGDCSDWIEIFNNSTGAVNLAGWHLTDSSSNPTKFTFPSPTWLGPGGFLLVFASGRTSDVPGGALHAPFKLDDDGEYLGLLRPDLGVAHAFAPAFPEQHEDYSYGFAQATPEWLAQDAEAAWRVPRAGDHDTAWITNGFDDSAWARGPAGLGLEGSAGNLIARLHRTTRRLADHAGRRGIRADQSRHLDAGHHRLPVGDQLLGHGRQQQLQQQQPVRDWQRGRRSTRSSCSRMAASSSVRRPLDVRREQRRRLRPFPLECRRLLQPQLSVLARRGQFAGRLQRALGRLYDLRLVYFQGGGDSLELFAAPGCLAAFNSSVFRLVGDVANGGLRVGSAAAGRRS